MARHVECFWSSAHVFRVPPSRDLARGNCADDYSQCPHWPPCGDSSTTPRPSALPAVQAPGSVLNLLRAACAATPSAWSGTLLAAPACAAVRGTWRTLRFSPSTPTQAETRSALFVASCTRYGRALSSGCARWLGLRHQRFDCAQRGQVHGLCSHRTGPCGGLRDERLEAALKSVLRHRRVRAFGRRDASRRQWVLSRTRAGLQWR